MSCSVCAAERKAASNCAGGSQTPASSMAPWKRPNFFVSQVAAESQSVTLRSVKNHVNIDPTRFAVSDTPASRAASSTRLTRSALNWSSRG